MYVSKVLAGRTYLNFYCLYAALGDGGVGVAKKDRTATVYCNYGGM